MVIPPNDDNSEKYFKSLNELNRSLALENLSMGMSADYIQAIKYESTFVRIWKFYLWSSILTLVLILILFNIFKS